MPVPIRMTYRLETSAEPDRTWRVMSDTDAFNRVARADFTYVTETDARGKATTVGTVRKLGLTLRFHEEPFSFRRPRWFRIKRVFENGPASTITATATMSPRPGGGTIIDYDLTVQPRGGLLRPILNFDLRRTTERNVGAALGAVVASLEQREAADPERALLGPPPALTPTQSARLEQLASRLRPSPYVTRLVALIRGAPEREQSMISPLALAQAWLAPLDEVVEACVDAARVGLLAARVDILCPSCLVPKTQLGADGAAPATHCETCRIPLDPSYPESLAVHFFPSPEVRQLRIKIECLGSPQRTPQVVAQDLAPPGQTVDLTIDLEPGTHQLRTYPQIGPAALVVAGDGEQGSEADFTLSGTIHPQLVKLRPEPRRISFTNTGGEAVTVVLEKLAPPRKVLTLGRLLVEFPALAEVVPAAGFYSTMACYVAQCLALRFGSDVAAARAAATLGRARVTYGSGSVVLALYAEPDALFQDLGGLALTEALAGIARGPAFEHVVGGRSVPMGPSVDAAYDACALGYPGKVAAPQASFGPEIRSAAERHRWSARTAPYQGPPIAWLERQGGRA
jgi:hypothetical protein